jgi:hypothetical protein
MKTKLLLLILAWLAQDGQAELTLMPKLPDTGWASYDVASVSGAVNWCCLDTPEQTGGNQLACDLDKRDQGFVSSDHQAVTTAAHVIRIFVQMQHGQVQSLRPVGLSCKITASQPVQYLGQVATYASLLWLQPKTGERDLMDSTLAAIAAHDSQQADQVLHKLILPALKIRLRKAALFWAGQLRGAAGFDLAATALQDSSAELRAHALFVMAQTTDARRTKFLIQSGQKDQSTHVRSQAWFWLAKASAANVANALPSIRQAALSDPDDGVREQAIFALSQLPNGEASKALMSLLNDRSVPKPTRERALFWLTQSDNPLAQKYLERALGD